MRVNLAPWVALVAAIAVFAVTFWVLGQDLFALIIAVLAFGGIAFGVYWMMDSRSSAEVASGQLSEATEREANRVGQVLANIRQLSDQVQDVAVRQALVTGCQDVLTLLELVRSRQPHNLFLSANSLVASTEGVEESLRGYLAIQDNPRLTPQERAEPLGRGATAFRDFAEDVRTRLRLVDVGDIAQYMGQLKRRAASDPDLPTP
jgi:hypothetical protein